MFRAVLESLAAGDLTKEVCSVDKSGEAASNWSMPALVSAAGRNLLAAVPAAAVEWLKFAAERDFKTLNCDLSNGLIAILVKRRSYLSFVDHHVALESELKEVLLRSKKAEQIAAVSGDCAPLAVEYLGRVVRTALKDRVIAVCPLLTKCPARAAGQR